MKPDQFRQSVGHAWRGIKLVVRQEQNFRVQLVLALIVSLCAWYFPLRRYEIIVVFGLIALVLILELVNSAVEVLVDLMKPRLSNQVKTVKDIMAAMVLLGSFFAAGIGLYIFLPYIVELL